MITNRENGQLVHRLRSALCPCGAIATGIQWVRGGYTLNCDAHRSEWARATEELDSSFRITPDEFSSVPGFGLLHHTEITRTADGRKIAAISTWEGHRRTFIRTRGLTWAFAERCAWCALYLRWNERQFAHLGIDPTADRPAVFGALGSRRFRVALPLVRYAFGMGRARAMAYRLQQRALHAIDGRR